MQMAFEFVDWEISKISDYLADKGLSVKSVEDSNIKINSYDNEVIVKRGSNTLHISEGRILDKISVLKVLTGNPSWIDDGFITAFQKSTEKLIKARDPQANIYVEKKSNRKFILTYEDQPIIVIKPDDSFIVVSGVSNEWDTEILNILSNIEEELPLFFFNIPFEWTVLAQPIIDPELWTVEMEDADTDPMQLVIDYIASSPTLQDLMNQIIDLFFRQGGWLEQYAIKRGIPYQERESQIKMAKQVLDTLLKSQQKLIIEAPTGTGKTFAYLVPVYVLAWIINRTIQSHVALGLIDNVFNQLNYRIAISTHTITLQKQIYSKDLPVIDEIFKNKLMFSLSYAIAMGRNNYVCLRQTHEYLDSLENSTKGKLTGIDEEVIQRKKSFVALVRNIIEERGLEHGFIDELKNLLWDNYEDLFFDMQDNIQSDSKNTLKDQCPFREQCFYYTNKEKWQNANILIMNHYLLAFALDLFPSYFKNIYGIIVDEGHHFPEVVRKQKGEVDFSISGIVRSLEKKMKRFQEIRDWLKGQGIPYRLKFLQNMSFIGKHVYDKYAKKLEEVNKKIISLKMTIDNISESRIMPVVDIMVDSKKQKDTFVIPIKPIDAIGNYISHISLDDIKNILINVEAILSDLKVVVQNVRNAMGHLTDILLKGYEKALYDIPSNESESLRKYIEILDKSIDDQFSSYEMTIQSFIDNLRNAQQIIEGEKSDEDCSKFAYWIELRRDKRSKRKNKYNIKLQKQAVFSGDLCRETISGTLMPFVFTSATMTTLDKFDFFMSSAGLDPFTDTITTEKLPPAFDYESQMEILVPIDAPNVKKNVKQADEYINFLVNNLKKWLVASQGQALVLFTSISMMRTVYEQVKDYLLSRGIEVYMQDNGMSRDMLLKTFKQKRFSVLFATKTFWEGIDVQGDSLQLLIITRLPFPNPSDINEVALAKCLSKQGKDKFIEYDLPVAGMLLRQAVGRLIRSETDSGIVIITDKRITNTNKPYSELLRQTLPTQITSLRSDEIAKRLADKINRD